MKTSNSKKETHIHISNVIENYENEKGTKGYTHEKQDEYGIRKNTQGTIL